MLSPPACESSGCSMSLPTLPSSALEVSHPPGVWSHITVNFIQIFLTADDVRAFLCLLAFVFLHLSPVQIFHA